MDINAYIRGNQGLSREQLAKDCGISKSAVRAREKRMGLVRKPAEEKVKEDRRHVRLKETQKETDSKYKALLRDHNALRDEMAAMRRVTGATSSYTIKPSKATDTSEATAVVLCSDWHVEEEVKPSSVNGLNKYNLDIAKSRATQMFQRIVRLLRKERQDVVINEMVLFLGGDFLTGRLHEENLESCLVRPVDAVIFAQELIEAGIKFILDHGKVNLTVICKSGNHGRITRKTHFSQELGNSLEYTMYHSLASRFPDVRFLIEDGYHTYLDVYGYTLRFHHGHAVRYQGGVGGLTIPLNKALHQWNLTRHADMDSVGH